MSDNCIDINYTPSVPNAIEFINMGIEDAYKCTVHMKTLNRITFDYPITNQYE